MKGLHSSVAGLSLACAFVFTSAFAAPVSFKPVDEAAKQRDFLAFRQQLSTAVARHDTKAVLAVVDLKIQNGFGDDNGFENFKKIWKLNQANVKHSALWKELGTVLALGGKFIDRTTFNAPYVAAAWPDNKDGFENIAIVGKDVRIREKPSTTSKVITTVSYVILPISPNSQWTEQWVSVIAPNGKKGYVSNIYARSPIDYRAFFEKKNGKWKMTSFLAGD
ncbi:SH3 domain-containing protein [Thiolinea disciformis]|uniref:SH3 domain-containing protein n=1 Tax=Thiolinea disciformis TaxID=125614 RepID=UPI00036000D9|nr:SH3 domain-containing protein [Thiolinea disciformis]